MIWQENGWTVRRIDVAMHTGDKPRWKGLRVIAPDGQMYEFYRIMPWREALKRAKHKHDTGHDMPVSLPRHTPRRKRLPPRLTRGR